jgi:flagellar motor switch protein FliG
VSTSGCEIVLAQAAEEIEWWRSQVPSPPPDTTAPTSPTSPPSPNVGPPLTGQPPVIGALAPPKLPSADAVKTAANLSTNAPVPTAALPEPEPAFTGSVLDRPRIKQVAALVKDMKPKDAALVVADLDESLAVGLLAKMPPRSASAIASALSPELAARLLTRLSQLPNIIVEEP